MRDRRAPIAADVCNSLQWFLLQLAPVMMLAEWLTGSARLIPYLLLTGLAFVAMALVARMVDKKPLIASAAVAVLICCVLPGASLVEHLCCAAMGVGALVCCLVIRRRTRGDGVEYTSMFVLTVIFPFLIFVSDWLSLDNSADMQYFCAVAYLPISIVAWYLSRSEYSLQVFDGKTAQPMDLIRRRTRSALFTMVSLVLLAALLLPGRGGESVIIAFGRGVFQSLLLMLVGVASCVTTGDERTTVFDVPSNLLHDTQSVGIAVEDKADGTSTNLWMMYVFYVIAGIILLAVVIRLVILLIKGVGQLVTLLLQRRGVTAKDTMLSEYDTVERIDRSALRADREPRIARTPGERIRRIYKRRIEKILAASPVNIDSSTPDEIAALCMEKGEDVSGLTALYKKARYTSRCTSRDVREAKRLA